MAKRKKQPSRAAAALPIPKRLKNHKTTKDPWEAAKEDEIYEVEKIVGQSFTLGVRIYEVKWVGYEKTTEEPLANLVNATEEVKAFEDARRAADAAAKEAAQLAKEAR